jgi:hypothetical protein
MTWLLIWLYLVTGELTVLWVLRGDKEAPRFHWLAEEKWWVPYSGAIGVVIAWPAVAALLLLVPKIK